MHDSDDRLDTTPLADEVTVTCPYCGERLLLYVDPALRGSMVHDCEVCCQPWQLTVRRDADGDLRVDADVL